MANLIEIITDELLTDSDDTNKSSEMIVVLYYNATETEQSTIDKIFTALCGYRLQTLIYKTINSS